MRLCRAESGGDFDAYGEKFGEVGACQIRLSSAREAVREIIPDFKMSNRALSDDLFARPHWWGQRVADKCHREGWRTKYETAYCYIGGWRNRKGWTNSNGQARRHAKRIAYRWEVERLKQLWASDL